jgi:hypothetical protein
MDERKTVEGQDLAIGKNKPERRYDIDWIRILAVLLLIYSHSACIFGYPSWQVNNAQRSAGMTQFMFFTSLWHMPLLFLVSGIGTAFALRFRTVDQYLKERVKRLLIPLIFGMLVLVPLQVYYERVGNLNFQGSYLKFYPYYFEQAYSHKDVDWHHLWFLGYLFLFSALALPLFLYLKKEAGQRLITKLAGFCQRIGVIFMGAIPLAIIEVTLRAKWPGSHNPLHDWTNFLYFLTFFIYGYFMVSDARFERTLDRHGTISFILAIAMTSIIFAWGANSPVPVYDYSPGYILYQIIHSFNSWFWVVAILSFGKKYLNVKSKLLKYANEAVLSFYILHQTAIIFIGFYVVRWNVGIVEKFLVISTLSLVLTIALYYLLVKRTKVTRFLFGMK